MPIAVDMKNIAEGIEVSYGERVAFLSDLFKDTNETLKTFHREHQKMADELRDSLSTSERERMKDFTILIGDVKAAVKAIEKDTANTRAENVKDLKAMAHKLTEFLLSSEKGRLEEFKSMLTAIKSKQRAREEEVAELLTAFQKDISEARAHWQNLAKIMASKRTGKRVPITEVPKEAEVSKRVEEAAEEAFGQGELKSKALALIEENPNGISLAQLGRELRIPYIRLGRPIRDLQDERKVVKRDSLYFPA